VAIKLNELQQRFGGVIIGNPELVISGIASLAQARKGDISFLANKRYRDQLAQTAASVVIVTEQDRLLCHTTAWVVKDTYSTYARVAQLLYATAPFEGGCHPSACIDETAEIAEDAWVGPHCVIGAGVKIASQCYLGPGCLVEQGCQIGAQTRLSARVTLCMGSQLGQRIIVHPGAVIGADGFGFANDQGQWIKIPQIGRVVIGNDVEIGANTTIDRGALNDTVIEDGVKLDNQIQVGHNVKIGAHTAIAACTGIAGSTEIGKNCAIGGYVGINGHIKIVDGVQITGKSFVTGSITQPGIYSSGYPLEGNRQWRRNAVRLHQLDDIAKRLKRLEKSGKD